MTEKLQTKQAMPPVGPRGLTQDYYNYVCQLKVVGDWMGGGIDAVNAHLRDNPIPLYTEAYPESVYESVINSYNREDVARINNIVQEINTLGEAGSLSFERWRNLDSQVFEILYGTAVTD
jgi:hypothetical protein